MLKTKNEEFSQEVPRFLLFFVCKGTGGLPVTLIEWILQDENVNKAIKSVKKNKGAYGIDKMSVEELDGYFAKHREEIKSQIRDGKYKPTPVKRVYIPKSNGKKRPLGIPTVVDRVVQQATAQVLSLGYDKYFSEHSYGFRPGRSCQQSTCIPQRRIRMGNRLGY